MMRPKLTPTQIARRKAYDKLMASPPVKPHPFCPPINTGPLKVRFSTSAMASI